MTLSAIVHEQAISNGHGLRVFGHVFRWHARKFGIQGFQLFVGLGHFCVVLARRRPSQLTGIGA